jgi:cyclin B
MVDDDYQAAYVASVPAPMAAVPAPAPVPVAARTLSSGLEDLSLSPAYNEDLRNPQMVSAYVDDIMAHLRASETRHRASDSYMSHQTDINPKMREILIDWLVEVHLKFKLRQETLYLTVNIIDRFLSVRPIQRNKLQLVGCTAMLIAAKYEEIYAPEVQDFVFVSDRAYTREQILSMESVILNELKFNVTVPYAMRFAERYVRLTRSTPEFKELVSFLIELTLQDYKFLRFNPSTVAAASVSLALHLTGSRSWSSALERETGYSEGQIRECVMDVWNLAAKENPKYRAVRRKYSASKYHGVARITITPPAEEAPRA